MMVVKATKAQCERFVTQKHYSRKPCIFWQGFALIENQTIQGVAVFGQPSPPIQKHAFVNRDFRLYELSRVVIQTKTPNAASYLISRSLRQLHPKPCAVISYADMEHSHCGIIYQATNWIYTGATISHDKTYIVNGEKLHPTTIRDRYGVTDPDRWAKENNYQSILPKAKHRYFYFVGNKTQKIIMQKKLKYPVINKYPKCNQSRYDDGPMITDVYFEQIDLFSINCRDAA